MASPASGAGSRLRVDLFGELRLSVDAKHVEIGPRMHRAVITLLALEPSRIVSVDRLIDMLWGGDAVAVSVGTLHSYVSQLRRIIEPNRIARAPATLLRTVDPGYLLAVNPLDVDIFRFEQLAREGREAREAGDLVLAEQRLHDAVTMWRSDVLAGFGAEQWAQGIVARLRENFAVAVEEQAEISLVQGRHAAAIGTLSELVEAEPLRERRWAQLLVALYRAGRQTDALRAYQRCRARLAEDLGIEPGPELRRIELAILEQSPQLDWVSPPTVPPTAAVIVRDVDRSPPATSRAVFARVVELDRLRERIGGLAEGGGAVLVMGEAGIGKTTLAQSAVTMASEAGCATVWARCIDDSAAPAYWPWLLVLRAVNAGIDDDVDGVAEVQEALDALGGVAPTTDEAALSEFMVYERVRVALQCASSAGPIVVVFDDLHAADGPSQRLLGLLAADLSRMSVLIVATARDNEGSLTFEQMIGEMVRHRGVERLTLHGLAVDDVRLRITEALGRAPSSELVASLHDRTGGNPFYLDELMRLLVSEHRQGLALEDVGSLDVPANVRDVLTRRIGRLPAETREMLALASVVGRFIDLDVLALAAGLEVEPLMTQLDPAVASGLLVDEEPNWGYRFRHTLVRDCVYTSLTRGARAKLHAKVGAALEATVGGDPATRVALLAHHYLQAGPLGDVGKAVTYCRTSADLSMRQGAWSEAARSLESGMGALGTVDPATAVLRCELMIELGRARRSAGDVVGAHEVLSSAIALADELGDDTKVSEAGALFGEVAPWGTRHYGDHDPHVIAILERQLDRIGDNVGLRIRLLATLGCELYWSTRRAEGVRYSTMAVELAREFGDAELLGLALTNGWTASTTKVQDAEATLETLSLVGTGLPRRTELAARLHHIGELAGRGDFVEYANQLARCQALVGELHSLEVDSQVQIAAASLALFEARPDDAERLGLDACEMMRRTSAPGAEWSSVALAAAVARARGMLGDFAEELGRGVDAPEFEMFRPYVVLGHAEAGRTELALELTSRWAKPPSADWTWKLPMSLWAAVCEMIGAPDPTWLLDELSPFSGEVAVVGIALDCGGSVDALLAGLCRRMGRLDDALRYARDGLGLEVRSGLSGWVPRTTALIARIEADIAAQN